MMKRAFLSLTITAIVLSACNSNTDHTAVSTEKTDETGVPIPKQMGAVNDFEGIISDEDEIDLSTAIENFEESTGNRIVVVTMDTIPSDEDATLFAAKIGNQWDVGDGSKNNGLIILMSEGVSQIGIATGQGVEQVYNDSVCDNVIRSIIPHLSVGDYSGGMEKAVSLLGEVSNPSEK
ncbi:TPM domain-containing protein [Owenweeksia hongkongensis]|uniref:TPM domain-containing protein n=1 Tax=Owenweeksia hongkongensis TaxID=253245 RepID=UPI003A9560A9